MITIIEKKTNKGYTARIYVNNEFSFVSFDSSSFANANRVALHTIRNNRKLSGLTILK